MSRIEMRGQLPRYPEDDMLFILGKLKEAEPCTVADLCRHLGIEPREGGSPSPDYNRVQAVLRKADEEERAHRPGGRGSWRTTR